MRKPGSIAGVGATLLAAATLVIMAVPTTSPAAQRMVLGEYFNANW